MANIRTLSDLERTENVQPLPNAWATARPSQYSYGDNQDDVREYGSAPVQYKRQYINCNGEVAESTPSDKGIRLLCLNCCPCFVDPCGEQRRSEFRKALCSFTLPLSMVQFAMLIVSIVVGQVVYGQGIAAYAENPAIGPGGDTFRLLGAKYGPDIRGGQVWRFITPIFLHAGIFHLLMNLLAQLRFGLYLERKWGSVRYVVIYLLAGVGASLMSCLLNFFNTSVGASGAIMGLLGAYLADIALTWHKTAKYQRVAALIQAVVWLAITMLFGISKYVDTAAHFGGALTGFFIGLALLAAEERSPSRVLAARLFGIALLSLYFVIGFILLYTLAKFNTSDAPV